MPNFETRFDRSTREWGVYSTCRLAYLVNCPASPDHGQRRELPVNYFIGGGSRDRRYADEMVAVFNAKESYVALGESST